MTDQSWWVYILVCGDGSLYTGCTVDVTSRVVQHNLGVGAKYTRSHLPVCLVYSEQCVDQSAALQREAAIKKLPRSEKLRLIQNKQAPVQ